ncbi:MAG: single-stranded DNA-binding protein [Rhodospirillales bacterium]|jgi:single-strand DNA-binding protein|nr:single-stranded DNA-binding protein [Rhodospirillales bacterium]
MAGSVNKVIIVGNLGRDPEVRHSQDGSRIVNFTVATSDSWQDKGSGERRERTEWHRVVIFNDKLGEIAERYLRKGSKVYLEGTLQTRKWTDKDGTERTTTEVVLPRFRGEMTLLDKRGEGGGGAVAGGDDYGFGEPAASPSGGRQPARGGRQPAIDIDDDIPF